MEAGFDSKGVRIAGASGALACLIAFVEFPLWFVAESVPPFWDAIAFSEFVARHSTLYLTRTLMDLFIFGLMIFFFGGFRQLIVMTRPSAEWLGTTFFGIAVMYVTLTLVSGSLAATVALHTIDGKADPAVVRALNESTILMFGSVGGFLVALLTSLAGFLILHTGALPRWTGWLALATALVNLAFVPTMYFGTDFTRFYSAAGDGPAAIAPAAFVLCLLATAITMMRHKSVHGAT